MLTFLNSETLYSLQCQKVVSYVAADYDIEHCYKVLLVWREPTVTGEPQRL